MARSRDGATGQPLVEGVYEHVVTEALARDLEASIIDRVVEELGDVDAHVVLARHLGREIERALATLPQDGRAEQARVLAAGLLDHLATLVPEAAADLADQRVPTKASRLLAVHRSKDPPARPATPLATSTLLTRGRNDPALGHELAREIAIADRIDAIVAFVTMGGVRSIQDQRYVPDDEAHRARLRAALATEAATDVPDGFLVTLRAFPFQDEILDRLAAERAIHGRRRNLVVAATGTGKTVIAAFDYQRQCAKTGVAPRLLFLAHREELLDQARRTFRYVLQDASFGELLAGGSRPRSDEHLFATIQSAASTGLLDRLGADYYRHIIVDECHHMPAASYQAIIPRLTPDLLVGLTATPERTDGKSLLPDFDGHIGAELRLWHAIDDQLLVPFEYYGLADGIDLRGVRWSRTGYDAAVLGELYTGDDRRAELVRNQLVKRVASVRDVRALGFCVSVEHAKFMAKRFTEAGIPSLAVYGEDPDGVRADAPRLLRERTVNVLFTCDLYNEGVDLPFVDTLLLLRPTQSATLFLQQLGRGLRHHRDVRDSRAKSSCLVLDFIGQHRDEFRFDATLSALTGIPRARLRTDLAQGFPYLPSGCTLQLDTVARDVILRSLRATLAGARRLTAELRELAAEGTRPRLAQFLAQTGRDLDDVYEAGGWTTLHRLRTNSSASPRSGWRSAG